LDTQRKMAFNLKGKIAAWFGRAPTGTRKRVVISSLFFFREDIAAEFCRSIIGQAVEMARKTGCEVEIVVSLNFPFSETRWAEIEQSVVDLLTGSVTFRLIKRGWNLGFGAGHNAVFSATPSDAFVALNNDIICEKKDWLVSFCGSLLDDNGADVVGASENKTALRSSDGCGIPTSEGSPYDFVDGSILGFRSSTARKLGLFSPELHYCYFEDSDLILRYRQAGAVVLEVSVPHQHIRHGSSMQLPREVVRELLDQNRSVFFARWAAYLDKVSRGFNHRIAVDLRQLRPVEFLDAWPTLIALAKSHPRTRIEVILSEDRTKPLLPLPESFAFVRAIEGPVDRVWAPKPRLITDPLPPVLSFIREVGGDRDTLQLAKVQLRTLLTGQGAEGFSTSDLALIEETEGALPGLGLPRPFSEHLITVFRTRGLLPQRCPADLSLLEKAALISRCKMVAAPVGEWSFLAQLLEKPTLLVCGAVMPSRGIWEWRTTVPLIQPELTCTGCQSRWGEGYKTYCLRGDEACLVPPPAGRLPKFLEELEAATTSAFGQALSLAQDTLLLSRHPSPELDLSRWKEL
jgi:GT2 family glycosyltransferase